MRHRPLLYRKHPCGGRSHDRTDTGIGGELAGDLFGRGDVQSDHSRITGKYGGFFAEPQFSSDNAAGISILAMLAQTGGVPK